MIFLRKKFRFPEVVLAVVCYYANNLSVFTVNNRKFPRYSMINNAKQM